MPGTSRWFHAEGRPALCFFESGEPDWPQLGINIWVLWPGQPMARYHWEADQEDFLVVSGEALAIVEDEERPMKAWDLLHCPANTTTDHRRRHRAVCRRVGRLARVPEHARNGAGIP